ncbi:T9SS type A sorting domain-containing protein [Sporocytophaga myxococcoides]|uniref:T9SS type A sorting domain-containing protein n=1 Tax=Sporocytophaga myxococcoides TaxID=153721 RepID=UPI0004227E4E|nr:T9SS type A sorting domain-containing protein [Sporocytophaga myxococcoides]
MTRQLLRRKGIYLSCIIFFLFNLTRLYGQQVKLPTDTTFSENLSKNPDRDLYPGEEFDIFFEMTGFPPGTIYIALMHKSDEEITIGGTTTGSPIHAKIPWDAVPGNYGVKVVAATSLPGRSKTIIIRDSLNYDINKWTSVSGNEAGKLQFTGAGERVAVSKPVNFSTGGFIQVDFKWLQTNTTANSDVYIEYSTDYGATWQQGTKLSPAVNYDKFMLYDFPASANSDHTLVRFKQPNYAAGTDGWKIDLILLDEQGNTIMPNYYENIHFAVLGPGIILNNPDSRTICDGQATTYSFTTRGTFPEGNVFTAQVSDKLGNFDNPIDIGTLSSTTGGTINATFPDNLQAGNLYKVRIIAVAGGKNISASDASPHLELGEYWNSTITKDQNILIAPEGTNYQWYKDNQLVDGATGKTFETSSSGYYSCKVTGTDGCSYITSAFGVGILGNYKKLAAENFTLFPNPSNDKITLTSLNTLQGEIEVSLHTSTGEKVYFQKIYLNQSTLDIDLNGFKRGVYYLMIIHDDERVYKPVLKL